MHLSPYLADSLSLSLSFSLSLSLTLSLSLSLFLSLSLSLSLSRSILVHRPINRYHCRVNPVFQVVPAGGKLEITVTRSAGPAKEEKVVVVTAKVWNTPLNVAHRDYCSFPLLPYFPDSIFVVCSLDFVLCRPRTRTSTRRRCSPNPDRRSSRSRSSAPCAYFDLFVV